MTFELDDDGYPTEATLEHIKTCKPDGDPMITWARQLLADVRGLWQYADAGYWREEDARDALDNAPITRHHVSTAGWSGNESIIQALRENFYFWSFYWVQHRRGGHYIFEVLK